MKQPKRPKKPVNALADLGDISGIVTNVLRQHHVAHSRYDERIRFARQEADRLQVPVDKIKLALQEAREATDRAAAIVMHSLVDDIMLTYMSAHMSIQSKKHRDRIFESNGPLSSNSNRILIAHALGWITDETKNALNAMRDIRNKFAHRVTIRHFSDEDPAELINSMPNIEDSFSALLGERHPDILESYKTDKRRIFLCRSIVLVSKLCNELCHLPIASRMQVFSADMHGRGDDELPAHMIDLRNITIDAVVEIFFEPKLKEQHEEGAVVYEDQMPSILSRWENQQKEPVVKRKSPEPDNGADPKSE